MNQKSSQLFNELYEDLLSIKENNLTVPGIIGKNEKHSNLK